MNIFIWQKYYSTINGNLLANFEINVKLHGVE